MTIAEDSQIGIIADRHGPLRVGIGGPVGSGKTALVEALCKRLRANYDICVITNDIYTKEDQLILTRAQALPAERLKALAVEKMARKRGMYCDGGGLWLRARPARGGREGPSSLGSS